jgi:hypothetical protein
MDSFVGTLQLYQEELAAVRAGRQPPLTDRNFDTGKASTFGAYRLADETCARLLIKLSEHNFDQMDENLRKSLVDYYGNSSPADPKATAALEQVKIAR